MVFKIKSFIARAGAFSFVLNKYPIMVHKHVRNDLSFLLFMVMNVCPVLSCTLLMVARILLWEFVLSFYHVSLQNQTQPWHAGRLGSEHLTCPLHLADPLLTKED